jgi:glycosyltransferase involved in cell wall biosynthesis
MWVQLESLLGMNDIYVSVVVPMRNEEDYIAACLQSILRNDYPAKLIEILVVDGGSSDSSREIVNEVISLNSNIRLLDNPMRITPTALNIGIDAAKGSVIVRMDVHAVYPSDYISRCVNDLVKYDADNVGGVWDIRPGADTSIAKAIVIAQSHPVGVGNVAYRIGSKGVKWVDTVPYGCYKKDTLKQLGGFDPELIRNQDDELNARLRKSGGRILLDPAIQCTYYSRSTLRQVGRMFYQYGYFKPLAAYKLGKVYTIRQLVPPLFVMFIILLVIGATLTSVAFWLLLVVLFVYFTVLVMASAKTALRGKFKVALWLPIVFSILHFSYGFGSLRGMIDLVIRKEKPGDVSFTR